MAEEFSLSAYLTAWATAIGAIWVLFAATEEAAKPQIRESASRWLQNLDPHGLVRSWPQQFAGVFDCIFGTRHLSKKCFWRSCIASTVAVIILLFIWRASGLRGVQSIPLCGSGPSLDFLFSDTCHELDTLDPELLLFLAIGVVVNLIPDYLSLLESRYLIRFMSTRYTVRRALAFLVLDGVFTAALALMGFWIFWGLAQIGLGLRPVGGFLAAVTSSLFPILLPFGVWFYSAFFTSLWLWLYVLAGLFVKVAGYTGIGINLLKRFVDFEQKPFKALGWVAIMLVTLGFVLAPLVQQI